MARTTTWTKERTQAAVDIITARGGGLAELAAEFGQTPETWCRRLKKYGIPSPTKIRRLRQTEIAAEVVEYLKCGHTQAQAVLRFKLSAVQVSRIAAKAGLPIRHRVTAAEAHERDPKIAASSLPVGLLAQRYDCTEGNIRRIQAKET